MDFEDEGGQSLTRQQDRLKREAGDRGDNPGGD
jgi:hypothetical protein